MTRKQIHKHTKIKLDKIENDVNEFFKIVYINNNLDGDGARQKAVYETKDKFHGTTVGIYKLKFENYDNIDEEQGTITILLLPSRLNAEVRKIWLSWGDKE